MLALTISRRHTALSPVTQADLARARCAARQQRPEAADAFDDGVACGWFDSSMDLLAGLTVVEHADLRGDALELALAQWLRQ